MKFSQYNIVIPMEYGFLVYNLKNENGVKITDSNEINELRQICDCGINEINDFVENLCDHGFIVDDDVDEFQVLKNELMHRLYSYNKRITILLHVTEDCNFRCIYCFKKAKPQYFSDKNWKNLYNYVVNQFENNDIDRIDISFYGGEPLLRANKIASFMEKVNNFIRKYPNKKINWSYLITNGYLLSSDIYDKLSSLGLKNIQVTLDGFAEQHDTMRPRVDGSGTWNKIIENLKYINSIDDSLRVIIRLNYNDSNQHIITEFKKWFYSIFSKTKFRLTFAPVDFLSEQVNSSLVMNDYKKREDIFEMSELPNAGLIPAFLNMSATCLYASINYMSMSAEGKVAMCEEFDNEEMIVGSLGTEGKIVYTKSPELLGERLEKEECKTCIAYPLCVSRACMKRHKCEEVLDNLHYKIECVKKGIVKLI